MTLPTSAGELEHSLEEHLARHSHRSHAVYHALLLLLLGTAILLPIVRVPVTTRAPGVIRPATEKQAVIATATGYVARVDARENERVEEGAQLLTLANGVPQERRKAIEGRLAEVEVLLREYGQLEHGFSTVGRDTLVGEVREELDLFARELEQVELRIARARQDLERARLLHTEHLIPASEWDERRYAEAHAVAERETLIQRRRREWQARIRELQRERTELRTSLRVADEDLTLHTIRAPVSGTVQELASLGPGSYVRSGQALAVISPGGEIVAEIYVPPRDIGLVEIGLPVRLLVDAFNHTDWGSLRGRVAAIADDYFVADGRPLFRVLVELEETSLGLRSGVRREVKKGMTVEARFHHAERSLWQLLRDDINDWLNPQPPARVPAGET